MCTATILDQGIPASTASFDDRFKAVFPIPDSYPTSDRPGLEAFSKAITSNLFGGIGYFYGASIVDDGFAYEWDEEDDFGYDDDGLGHQSRRGPRLTEPTALFTAIPTRSFFPRGFYWFSPSHRLVGFPVLTMAQGRRLSLATHRRMGQRSKVRSLTRCVLSTTDPRSLEILKSWIDLIDENGWVAREQILGEEARSRVSTDTPSAISEGP